MSQLSILEKIGYDHYVDECRVERGVEIEQIARVTAEHKGAYEVINTNGEFRATVTGRRLLIAASRDDYPAVGDWVIIKNINEDSKVIDEILPRKTTLHKKYGGKDESQLMAANVDVAFIVESMDRDYNLNRFERYVVIARAGGVKPVIILNKTDLLEDNDFNVRIEQIRERFGDIDIFTTSTATSMGLVTLAGYIQPGNTYCFLGSSGVGKSSLINKLLDNQDIATAAVGEKTGRGKHTTTAREMYFTRSGGIIIDNPGSREVGVTDATSGIKEAFADIDSIAGECRFKDCRHGSEPNCAIIDALNKGIINNEQYDNYQKLRKEVAHHELSTYGKRQKDRSFGKFIKIAKKDFIKHHPYDETRF